MIHENTFCSFKCYRLHMIFKLTITKGHNYVKVLVSTYIYIFMAYIYMPDFGRICQGFQSKRVNTKNYQGKEFCENVGIVMVFIFFTLSDNTLYLYQGSWKYLSRFSSYRGDSIFKRKITKGHNLVKNVDRVIFVHFCISSDHVLYL